MPALRTLLTLAGFGATVLAAGPALADPPWVRGYWYRPWGPPPVYYAPPPPPPVYVVPPPAVVYAPPPPVYYAPPPPRVYYAPPPPPPPPALGFSLNIPLR